MTIFFGNILKWTESCSGILGYWNKTRADIYWEFQSNICCSAELKHESDFKWKVKVQKRLILIGKNFVTNSYRLLLNS